MSNRHRASTPRASLPAAHAPALTHAQYDDLARYQRYPQIAALLAGVADARSASDAVTLMVPVIITLARIVPGGHVAAWRVLAGGDA